METVTSVNREIDKVLCKFNLFSDHASTTLGKLQFDISSLQEEIKKVENGDVTEAQSIILQQALNRVKDVVSKIGAEHRDLHSSVSKVGKAIDKNFTSDFGCLSNNAYFSGEKQDLIYDVICQHFFREGLLDIAEELVAEAHLHLSEEARAPFFELNSILEALKMHNLQPALQWTVENREKLRAQNSTMEFKLHRLAYINILCEAPSNVGLAIEYARINFAPFVRDYEKAIQVLMGCLLYVKGGLANSPYASLLGPQQWMEIADVFTRDACALLGLSLQSSLAVCVNAGCTALPVLLNIKQVMQQRQVQGMWSSKDELPIEIDLGPSCRYHSIFACPILRQQSTEANPPMRLVCGHVISRDALNKLTSGNKLKCPYCPVEQNPTDAIQIYF